MNFEADSETETSPEPRVSVFRVRVSLLHHKKGIFLLKSFYFSPSPLDFDSESETSLRYLQKSRPIPRLRRVLNRETRCFESETRDSGNSDSECRKILIEPISFKKDIIKRNLIFIMLSNTFNQQLCTMTFAPEKPYDVSSETLPPLRMLAA